MFAKYALFKITVVLGFRQNYITFHIFRQKYAL